jgi:hypothetical protein
MFFHKRACVNSSQNRVAISARCKACVIPGDARDKNISLLVEVKPSGALPRDEARTTQLSAQMLGRVRALGARFGGGAHLAGRSRTAMTRCAEQARERVLR